MAPHQRSVCLRSLLITAALLVCCVDSDITQGGKLERLLKKRDAGRPAGRDVVAVAPDRAQQFLSGAHGRPRRNVWDRSRPDVQQWIMQFMHMGYDEARLETDLSYWMDHWRSSDQGRQHHYDENAPVGPQDPANYRHGANVNYDYY